MLNFPDITYQNQMKEERKKYSRIEKKRREFCNCRMLDGIRKDIDIPAIRTLPLDLFPISQKYSSVSKLPYGLVGTVEEAGCGVLAVEYALRLIGIYIDFRDILDECVKKGYRAYVYDENDKIVDGDGTKTELFNNLAIECKDVFEIIWLLSSGNPITLLIKNSVYHNDPNAKESHYITLVGIDESENALIMDGNLIFDPEVPLYAFHVLPFREMIKGVEGAWAWEKEKVKGYLK